MPTATFSVAASTDDQNVLRSGSSYPPTSGTFTRTTTGTTNFAERCLGGSTYRVSCGLLRWDTSALPDDAVVSAAVLRMVSAGKDETNSLNLTAGWYAWDGVSNSDWTNTPETSALAAYDLTTWPASGSFDITLANAAANVSKTGYTSLRLHVSQRSSDAAPTDHNHGVFWSYDDATNAAPELVVTYTAAAGDLVGMTGI